MSEFKKKSRKTKSSKSRDDDGYEISRRNRYEDDDDEEEEDYEEENMNDEDENDEDDEDDEEEIGQPMGIAGESNDDYDPVDDEAAIFYSTSDSAISEALNKGYNVEFINFQHAAKLSDMGEKEIVLSSGTTDNKKMCNIRQIFVYGVENGFPLSVSANIVGVNAEFITNRGNGVKSPAHYIAEAGEKPSNGFTRPVIAKKKEMSDKRFAKFLSDHAELNASDISKIIAPSSVGTKNEFLAKTESPINDFIKASPKKYRHKINGNYMVFSEKVGKQVEEDLKMKLKDRHHVHLENIKLEISRARHSDEKSNEKPKWSDINNELQIGNSAEDKQNASKLLNLPYKFHMKIAVIYSPVTGKCDKA